jgi:hypothetical protein
MRVAPASEAAKAKSALERTEVETFLAAVRLSIELYDSWEHRYLFTFIGTRISACTGTEHHEFALFIWLSICL